MASPWQAIRIDEIEPISVAGVHWHPLRRTLGIGAFGVNAYSGHTGEHVVEEHSEERLQHEEIYVVLSGSARFTMDGEERDVAAGGMVFLSDPTVRRGAVALEDGTRVLAVGGKPGEAYTPSAWEAYFMADRHRATGDFEAMAAELEAALDEFPDHPGVIYCIACAKALAGRTDEALSSLRRSLELDPLQHDWATRDEDLVSLRGLPGSPI
ncbi:MAG: TPR end-of-group domain-containing protein [Gaiella sp.]